MLPLIDGVIAQQFEAERLALEAEEAAMEAERKRQAEIEAMYAGSKTRCCSIWAIVPMQFEWACMCALFWQILGTIQSLGLLVAGAIV